jgi:hypothetical protein
MACWPRKVIAGCRGKVRHASHGKAEAHVRALRRKEDEHSPDALGAYYCVKCRSWHVGHK